MKLCLNIFAIISILVAVCIVIVCIISYIENRRLVVTRYTIKDNRIPQGFHGFRIVQITDLHNACYGIQNELLYEKIQQCRPEAIFVTGDMIIGKPGNDVSFAANTINKLCEIAPVYFSMGNHELRASIYRETYGNMWEDFYKGLCPEVHMLLDGTEVVNRDGDAIYLHGLNLTPQLYKRMVRTPMEADYLNNLFGECDKTAYHVFLAHNPDYFEDYALWGANLTFSGHVHGGMIRIPFLGGALSPMIHIFPKYDKGVFQYKEEYMVLSGGLGNHTFKFRVNNLPEIILVTLERENATI